MGYTLSWEPRGVVLRFAGRVTISDILSASNAYQGNRWYDELLYVIADYSQITDCDARPTDIDDVWAVDYGAKRSNNKIKKAIVTTSPEVVALARRYAAAPDPAFPVKVFAKEADARAWLTE
jgi:hypothetical protein